MEYETKYTVSLQGRRFTLTRSQLEFDSPNYFTAAFLGEFRESQTRYLELNRDPGLFSLICTYLCGYKILPVQDYILAALRSTHPLGFSSAATLLNLRADAVFYQLDGLVEACDGYIELSGIQDPPKNDYIAIGTQFETDEDAHIFTRLDTALLHPHWKTRISPDRLTQRPTTPDTVEGFDGLRTIALIERFAERAVLDYSKKRYKLVGWHVQEVSYEGLDQVDCEMLVVLEDLKSVDPLY